MLASQIKVGKVYEAKVSNKLTKVRVERIYDGRGKTSWTVTNLNTDRQTTFFSARKFRKEVEAPPPVVKAEKPVRTDLDKACFWMMRTAQTLQTVAAETGSEKARRAARVIYQTVHALEHGSVYKVAGAAEEFDHCMTNEPQEEQYSNVNASH